MNLVPRFHLSTLLLLCILAGACIGIKLSCPLWKLEYTLPHEIQKIENYSNYGNPFSISVNETGTYMLVIGNHKGYVFDLRERKVAWTLRMSDFLRSVEVRFREKGSILEVRTRISRKHWESYQELVSADGSTSKAALPPLEWNSNRIQAPQEIAAPDISSFTKEIKTSFGIQSFNNNWNLALGFADRVDVWRRTRNYGWAGYLESPLTWVALLSSTGLIVIFVRWIRAYMRLRSSRNG